MANVAIPFPDLAERIQQHEAELAKLRQALEARQTHLSDLTRRKEELQSELQKIDQEIEAVGQNGTASSPATPLKPVLHKTSGKRVKGVSLSSYLVSLVKKAKGPISAKELADLVVRNKYPTTAKDVEGMVKTRVYDLVKKGVLRRLDDSSGFVLAKGASMPIEAKAPAGVQKNGKKIPAKPQTPAQSAKWRSLHFLPRKSILDSIHCTSDRHEAAQSNQLD